MYSERCARNSYGVLCRELYDEKKHTGEDVTKDHRDKKKWVECQIDWLIKKVRFPSVKTIAVNNADGYIEDRARRCPRKTV